MKKADFLTVLAVGFLLLGTSVGCSLCCAPYDYCGPVYANGQCSNLARFRCGTAFGQSGCGASPQVTPNENGGTHQALPASEPGGNPRIQPTPASSPQIQQSPRVALPPQTQYRPASINAQVPQQIAHTNPSVQQVLPPVSSVGATDAIPQNGAIAVGADGYQKVEVYDENNQLMGYEIIDATGKSVSQLPAPSHVR